MDFEALVMFLLKVFGAASLAAVLAVIAGALTIKGYLLPYLETKAKFLAKLEELPTTVQLTEAVRKVEHKYDHMLEQSRLSSQLLVAALDRRLAAHQQAYDIARRLAAFAQNSQIPEDAKALATFETWWSQNCLYLTSVSANALYRARSSIPMYRANQGNNAADDAWKVISAAELVIAKEAGALLAPETRVAASVSQDA